MSKQFLSAKEAAEELGISVATLYAYVSRGLVRSEAAGGGKSRTRRYNGNDIATLKRKQQYRHNPDQIAHATLQRGMPVLDSAITLIHEGQLSYRGHDALALATTRQFEEVASLLWSGSFAMGTLFTQPPHIYQTGWSDIGHELNMLERFQAVFPLAAAQDVAAYDQTVLGLQKTGARIMQLMARMVVGSHHNRSFESIAHGLQMAWAPQSPDARLPLEAALILCADHELNVSAFTARCIASAGSTLYQVMQGGLAALQGFRHGGHTERVTALFEQVDRGDVAQNVVAYIKRGESLPGFHHPLYPQGDPRGRLLLELAVRYHQNEEALKRSQTVQRTVWQTLERHPTIDFGLVTLARVLGLPKDAPLILFALGRSAGWIAHAIEQYQSQLLIRPRARYVGEPVS